MDALNEKERTIALLKFTVLFLFTVILIVVAVFYGIKVPSKQVEILRAENDRLLGIRANTKLILVSIDSVKYKLDRYSNEPNKEILEREIGSEFDALAKYSLKDTTNFGNIISRVINEFKDHLVDKKNLLKAGDCSITVNELNAQISKLKSEVKDCDTELINQGFKLKACVNNN